MPDPIVLTHAADTLIYADRDPTSLDDSVVTYNSIDYSIPLLALWRNVTPSPNRLWICVDNTNGAAVWLELIVATQADTATGTALGKNVKFASRNFLTIGD